MRRDEKRRERRRRKEEKIEIEKRRDENVKFYEV